MVTARALRTDGPNYKKFMNNDCILGGLLDAIGIIVSYTDEHIEDMGDIFRIGDKKEEQSGCRYINSFSLAGILPKDGPTQGFVTPLNWGAGRVANQSGTLEVTKGWKRIPPTLLPFFYGSETLVRPKKRIRAIGAPGNVNPMGPGNLWAERGPC